MAPPVARRIEQLGKLRRVAQQAQGAGQPGKQSGLGSDLDDKHRRHRVGNEDGNADEVEHPAPCPPGLDQGGAHRHPQYHGKHGREQGDAEAHPQRVQKRLLPEQRPIVVQRGPGQSESGDIPQALGQDIPDRDQQQRHDRQEREEEQQRRKLPFSHIPSRIQRGTAGPYPAVVFSPGELTGPPLLPARSPRGWGPGRRASRAGGAPAAPPA